jgi:hypothetical protein
MRPERVSLLVVARYGWTLAMSSDLLEQITSSDGNRRALIKRAGEGRILVEIVHLVAGDGVHEPRAYWSRVRQPVTVTDSIENARRLAAEAIGEPVLGDPG